MCCCVAATRRESELAFTLYTDYVYDMTNHFPSPPAPFAAQIPQDSPPGCRSVADYLDGLAAKGQPVPSRRSSADVPWWGEIERAAGTYPLFLSKRPGATARALVLRAVRQLGIAPHGPTMMVAETLTIAAAFGRYYQHLRDDAERGARYANRAIHPARKLETVIRHDDREGGSAPVLAAIEKIERRLAAGEIRNAATLAATLAEFKDFVATIPANGPLPDSFPAALSTVIRGIGHSAISLAKELGVPHGTLTHWQAGRKVPNQRSHHVIEAIEVLAGLKKGELVGRIEHARAGSGRVPQCQFPEELRGPEHRRRRSLVSARTPAGALPRDESARHAMLRAVNADLDRTACEAAVVDAIRKDSYRLKDWPDALEAEFDALIAFKTEIVPSVGLQHSGKPVRASTLAIRRQHLGQYLGCLVDRIGTPFRIARDDASILLFASAHHLREFLSWKVARNASGGRDPRLTSTDADFVTTAGSLFAELHGFIRQRPEMAATMNRLLARYDLAICRRNGEAWRSVTAAEWPNFCSDVYGGLKQLEASLRTRITARHRYRDLMPVLELEDPLSVVFSAIDTLRGELRQLGRGTLAHARLQRGILILNISTQVAMRPETWSQITVGENRTHDLYCEDGSWDFAIPGWKIKNGETAARFRDDPFWRRKLKDDAQLYADLREYLDVSRPLLLDGRQSDLLIVGGKKEAGLTKGSLNNLARKLILELIGPHARNDNHALRLPAFSLHALRHVLATTILKRTSDAQLAADVLADEVETVRDYYAFWCARDRERRLIDALGRR